MLVVVKILSVFLLLFAVCTSPVAASAQAHPSEPARPTIASQIPARVKGFIDNQTVAGAVTLVAHGSDVVEFNAVGMADIEAGHPMQKDTIFQIMSMTKPVTAIAVMMLADEGKLALRDPVEQYLPEFKDQRVAVE